MDKQSIADLVKKTAYSLLTTQQISDVTCASLFCGYSSNSSSAHMTLADGTKIEIKIEVPNAKQ